MENDPIICRMCLESQEGFISLESKLESSTVISYLEAYIFCTKLNASSTDPFPKVICIECASKLTFIYETIQKAIDSDHMMRELYKNEIDIQKVNPVIEHSEEINEEPELSSNIATEALKKQSDTEDNYCDDYESQENHYIEEYLIKSEDEDCQQETEFIELECSICEITFLTQTDLFEHCKTHDDKPQCLEEVVPEEEKQPPVEKHPKKTSEKSARMFICEVCGKCFASRQKLTQHNLVHTKEKNFPCDLCPKRFATVYRQRHHIKTSHSSEGRNFECHICHKQFVLKHTLSVHLRLHTGERPYKCPMCDKCFSQPSIMRTHAALHTGKTVKCDMCPKTFSRSSQLIVHSRSHTGERPYLCNLCPNRYRQKSHLDRHMDTHMGLKHKCNICGKEYTKKSTLTAHMFVHSEVKQFKCDECPLEFETRARYRRHWKHTHNTQNKEETPS